MKNVILGTAGHVDHGKTALIHALTGIDTDRLIEEKRRGITIELGFAHLDFSDGLRVGIVDVPGHEKFIKNMLAGAGGIDLGMLVVAANESVMPQTVEHLNILRILGIKDGLVVISKKDMVDDEWIELVREEISALVKGTFLEGKPIVAVSAHTGEGLERLKEEIRRLVLATEDKNLKIPFRLPVDRVFPVDGFGTVVTGTLIEGVVSVGDIAEISPSGCTAKVRSLQVHGKDVAAASSGQRVAINLAGIKRDEIARGDVVAKQGSLNTSLLLDVRLDLLPNSKRTVKNGSMLHLYHGSRELLAKVVLLDRDMLKPGESCYAQFRMKEALPSKIGDPFVVRFLSPLETIGGGVVLDDNPAKHKRNQKSVIDGLKVRENGSLEKKLVQLIAEHGFAMPNAAQLAKVLNLQHEDIIDEIHSLVSRGVIVEARPDAYIAASSLDSLWLSCKKILQDYHAANPLHAGMRLPALRQKLFKTLGKAECDAILKIFAAEEKIRISADTAALHDFKIEFTKRQNAIYKKILDMYTQWRLEVPNSDEVIAMFPPKERDDAKKVFESMLSSGMLVSIAPQLCIFKDSYDEAFAKLLECFKDSEEVSLAYYRDFLKTSRKYAMALMEHFDKMKITRYDGASRRLIAKGI
ncbi:MAG: selenocysteine-specific translation elongation factor [Oscillospiraceae bacterium]|nr:selenocysteine-specific translation elongation factor [Oscillospiraceae bacterium]